MREDIPISTLTTMKIGGPAKYLREITDSRQLRDAYIFARENNLPVFILGSGSNTIASDAGFPGLILVNKIRGYQILHELAGKIIISGGSGELLDDFIEFGTKRGYSGLEAMSAIPGTLGGATVGNAGAYGQEISDVIDSVDVFDIKTGRFDTLPADKLRFGYRKSPFNSGNTRYFITRVAVRLKKTTLQPPLYPSLQNFIDKNKITDLSPTNIREIVTKLRAEKLPDPANEPSAGSFFKNIILSDKQVEEAQAKGLEVWQENGRNTLNSGYLIEKAGLKGQEFNGFRISDKSALILINVSATSSADLDQAKNHIIETVQEKFGYRLEPEPIEIK